MRSGDRCCYTDTLSLWISPAVRTTSTAQCARAATAADTLPRRNRSTRLRPRAPTKRPSACHCSASSRSTCFGSPAVMTDETVRPRVRRRSAIGSTVFATQTLSSASCVAVSVSPGSDMKARAVYILGSIAVTRRTALSAGHARAATACTAAAASGEPSTPMRRRRGLVSVWGR